MFFWPAAVARPSYRLQAINQFNLVADSGGVRVVTCQYCHLSPNGGAFWNAFGDRVRSSFKGSIGEALYQALVAMEDSDGDGYADVLEVFAGTLPGDARSKPLVRAQFLWQALEKAGGVDIYKPR
ncbi:thrombospondin type 3 repeat-containing protein [Meiothermus rufus]|uniref:thrombospondin type 3 repeat-containing protein n=1 Tax=Meiothermus rufus TaxID=604332 RepID=UPI001FE1D579|nr:thrombospondin type 3 repeat-containing protein [Meiothermus rufus]